MVAPAPVPIDEIIRACACCLAPLPPNQRVYCAGTMCKQIVRLWRLKMTIAVKS